MRDTKIAIFGKTALVEAEHVKCFMKKDMLVKEARRCQEQMKTFDGALTREFYQTKLQKIMGQIIRLNRKMNREGMHCQFVD